MMRRERCLGVMGSLGLILTISAGLRVEATTPKNVIFFIGDGMGTGEVQAAGLYGYGVAGGLGFERFPAQALMVTAAADSPVTDSAAAATAMATGHRVNNGVLSLALPGDGRELTTILEYGQGRGKSSGLVTTSYITDATPAAFAAHESSRSRLAAIAADILQKTQPQVLLGGASGMEGAGAAGYTVIRTAAELAAIDTETTGLLSGQFSKGSMTYVHDRTLDTTEPTLALMTARALEILDREPNGLFLMAEGGLIDHAGHAHDLVRSVQETLSLDQAVRAALDWAAATGQASNTLILVTADHETGGLRVISSQGAGQLPLVSWDAAGHTGALVPVYAYGPHSDWVRGTLDNTDLFRVMRGLTLSLPYTGPGLDEAIWSGSVSAGREGDQITGVTAAGVGTTLETDVLYVGSGGTGQVAVLDGAVLTTLHGFVGYGPSDTGQVRVSGSGSVWDNHGQVVLGGDWAGARGTGYLEVSQGAVVKAKGLTIWQTGVLAGTGVVQADSVVNHGTLRPGMSIGTLTIAGDLAFEPNSILEVQVDNAGHSDKVVVTGDVGIHGGTVKAVSTETITHNQRYRIVEAKDVVGAFDALDTALLSIDAQVEDANASLGYAHDVVSLDIGASRFDDPGVANTGNQRRLGQALQQIADSGGSPVTHSLQAVVGEDSLRTAYDQLAGVTRPSLASLATADLAHFMGSTIGRTRIALAPSEASTSWDADLREEDASSLAGPYGPCMVVGRGGQILQDQPWGLWIQGEGAWADRNGGQDRAGYRAATYGTAMGYDWMPGDAMVIGITAGGADTRVNYKAQPDSSRVEAFHAGVYGSMTFDRGYLETAWTYTDLRYHTERSVALTGEHLEGDSGGYGVGVYAEAGWNAKETAGWRWRPLTSLRVVHVGLDDEQETGGASALGFARQAQTSVQGSLGLRVAGPWAIPGLPDATACVQGRWTHEFGDKDAELEAHFIDYPSAVFAVRDEGTRDSALVGAGLSVPLRRSATFRLHYDVSISAIEAVHLFGAVLQYCW